MTLARQARAHSMGTTADALLAEEEAAVPLGRLPRLAEVGAVAALVASDRAAAVTGAVVNLTSGAILD